MKPKPTRDAARPPASLESVGLALAELETFIAVARLGSFSLAARQLHVTQPSVTGRVQRLETALCTKLLVRTTRRVEPTPEGTELLEEASKAMAGLRKLVARFRRDASQAGRRVVVATTPMLASMMFPSLIRDYSQRFTDASVVLRDLRHEEVFAAVNDGSADIGVAALAGHDRRFRTQFLATEEMLLVTPRDHPLAAFGSVTLDQIAPHSLLIIKQWASMREQISEELSKRSIPLAPSIIVDNLHTLLGMLDAGMGPTLLHRAMAPRAAALGHACIEIADFKLIRRYYIVSRAGAELASAADRFCRFLKSALK